VLLSPLLRPSGFDAGRLLPLAPQAGSEGPLETAALLAKWTFVAAWTAYGAEMASTLCAEMRDCACRIPRTMRLSAGVCLVAFSLVPVVVIGTGGPAASSGDPLASFAPLGASLLGGAGRDVMAVMLAAALVLGAQAFVLGSSRTIYQLARDGHLPPVFARTNRRGVPTGSLVCDASVIGLMLLAFGDGVVNVVAAANVPYMVVFILMPIAYLSLSKSPDGDPEAARLPGGFRLVAAALIGFNVVVLTVGGWQWGPQVMTVGAGLALAIVPISWLTRRAAARASTPPRTRKEADWTVVSPTVTS
jgi:amino acid transporter